MKGFFVRIRNVFSALPLKQVLSLALVGVLFMSSTAMATDLSSTVESKLNRMMSKGEDGRPRTTGQWEARNEELQGKPGEQLKQIGEQAADAVSEMADIYPQNAKTLTPGVDNGELPSD